MPIVVLGPVLSAHLLPAFCLSTTASSGQDVLLLVCTRQSTCRPEQRSPETVSMRQQFREDCSIRGEQSSHPQGVQILSWRGLTCGLCSREQSDTAVHRSGSSMLFAEAVLGVTTVFQDPHSVIAITLTNYLRTSLGGAGGPGLRRRLTMTLVSRCTNAVQCRAYALAPAYKIYCLHHWLC